MSNNKNEAPRLMTMVSEDDAIVFDDELEDANDEMGTESRMSEEEDKSAGVYEVNSDEDTEYDDTSVAPKTKATTTSTAVVAIDRITPRSSSLMSTRSNDRSTRSSQTLSVQEPVVADLERPTTMPAVSPQQRVETASVASTTRSHGTRGGTKSNHATDRAPAFLWGMTKPVAFAVAVAMILMITTGSIFFAQLPEIRGLNDQIDDLEEEVNRLETQITVLNNQVDRLSGEVSRLDDQVKLLASENSRLATSNEVFATSNEELKISNRMLSDSNEALELRLQVLNSTTEENGLQVIALGEENIELRSLTTSLNATIQELQGQNAQLDSANADLTETNLGLESQLQRLEDDMLDLDKENTELETINRELNGQVVELNDKTLELEAQISRFEALLGFLNSTVGNDNSNGTFLDAVEELEGLVDTNRVLVLESLQNNYENIAGFWLCDFTTDFAGSPFILLPERPIGEAEFADVMQNVEAGVMDPLCLDVNDFEDFINAFFFGLAVGSPAPTEVTTNELRLAVSRYTTLSTEYYFPVGEDPGLTPQDWTEATYDCKNLPNDKRYQWNGFQFGPKN